MSNSPEQSQYHYRLKRRRFLASLLFGGSALTLAGLQQAQAQANPTEGWTIPDLKIENPKPTPTPPPQPPPQPPTAGVPLPRPLPPGEPVPPPPHPKGKFAPPPPPPHLDGDVGPPYPPDED